MPTSKPQNSLLFNYFKKSIHIQISYQNRIAFFILIKLLAKSQIIVVMNRIYKMNFFSSVAVVVFRLEVLFHIQRIQYNKLYFLIWFTTYLKISTICSHNIYFYNRAFKKAKKTLFVSIQSIITFKVLKIRRPPWNQT